MMASYKIKLSLKLYIKAIFFEFIVNSKLSPHWEPRIITLVNKQGNSLQASNVHCKRLSLPRFFFFLLHFIRNCLIYFIRSDGRLLQENIYSGLHCFWNPTLFKTLVSQQTFFKTDQLYIINIQKWKTSQYQAIIEIISLQIEN